MALLTSLRDAQRHVVGVARLLVVRQMAALAGRRRSLVLAPDVARSAIKRRVHPGQGKPRALQVIELGAQPGIHCVALLAFDRERGCGSGVARGVCLLIRRLMTRVAPDVEPLELAHRRALMAIGAI